MTITKLGHCCLLIEIGKIRLLTDPGIFTVELQQSLSDLDAILITHEHPDHFHIESVKALVAKNPEIRIVTNSSVGKILTTEEMTLETLEQGQSTTVNGIDIRGFGNEHAQIYMDYGRVQNTGYRIDERFFYPGDAFTVPGEPIEILALPVAGPWMKLREAIDYALALKPRLVFPVHDGILSFTKPFHAIPEKFLAEAGITFVVPKLGQSFLVDQQ